MSDRVRLFLFIGLTLFGAVVLLFAAVGVLVAGPTLLQWSIDGYQGHELFSSASPDGRYRIGGSVRVDFPANEMLDPSGTLRITLLDSHTGKLLDQLSVGLFEADDFQKPKILWQPDGRVQVQDMESGSHHLSATLDAHAWDVAK